MSAIRDFDVSCEGLFGGMREDCDEELRFRVLGPLQLREQGRDYTPSAPKVRQVLALLLMRCNHVVATESLIYELWLENPPPSALTTIQTYVYHLRKTLQKEGVTSAGHLDVTTRSPGYELQVDPKEIDLFRFQEAFRNGRRHIDGQDRESAVAELRRGLAMWRGDPLGNVEAGPQVSAYRDQMSESWKSALQLCIEAEMQMGKHAELVGELRTLVASYPFDEWLYGCLMRALELAGRRRDALAVYHDLRRRLHGELGLDPSPELQDLHQDLLTVGVR